MDLIKRKERFTCGVCTEQFFELEDIEQHLKEKHVFGVKEPCSFCGGMEIAVHEASYNNEQLVAVCLDCGSKGPPVKTDSPIVAGEKWNKRK